MKIDIPMNFDLDDIPVCRPQATCDECGKAMTCLKVNSSDCAIADVDRIRFRLRIDMVCVKCGGHQVYRVAFDQPVEESEVQKALREDWTDARQRVLARDLTRKAS